MRALSAGRLSVSQYDIANGDQITLVQTHRNGSSEVMGEMVFDGSEIEDALYLLNRAMRRRERDVRKRDRDKS